MSDDSQGGGGCGLVLSYFLFVVIGSAVAIYCVVRFVKWAWEN